MSFWKRKKQLNSDEFEQLIKRIVACVGDLDNLSSRCDGIETIAKSNRAKINVLNREKIEGPTEDIKNDEPKYI